MKKIAYLSKFGKIADLLIFIALAALAVSLMLKGVPHRIPILVLIVLAFLIFGLVFNRMRERKTKEKQYRAAERTIRMEKLLMMSDQSIQNRLNDENVRIIRKMQPDRGEVLFAMSQHPDILICNGTPDPHYANTMQWMDFDRAIEVLSVSCTSEEVQSRLNEQERKPKRTWKLPVQWNRYFLLGTLLLVLSLFTGHKIYYRALSGVCMILSVFHGFPARKTG